MERSGAPPAVDGCHPWLDSLQNGPAAALLRHLQCQQATLVSDVERRPIAAWKGHRAVAPWLAGNSGSVAQPNSNKVTPLLAAQLEAPGASPPRPGRALPSHRRWLRQRFHRRHPRRR